MEVLNVLIVSSDLGSIKNEEYQSHRNHVDNIARMLKRLHQSARKNA